MIEPLTEWLLAASPTKNQAAYEHFLGCCPAGRRSSPPTRTTRSVAPSPPRCRARTPRRPSTPGRVAPWPLAARPTARCARGGRGRRWEGRESPLPAPNGVCASSATATGSPPRSPARSCSSNTHIDVVEDDHPDRRFGVALCLRGYRYTSSDGVSRIAATPVGTFTIYRKLPGRHHSSRLHVLPVLLRRQVRDPRRPVRASNTGQRRMHPHPMSAALGFYARKPVGTPVFVVR